jgi:rubredoxin
MLYNRITKPALCEHCKAPPKKGQIGGYHWHGYSNPLDVKWLCPRCQGMARKGFITFEEKI